MRAGAQRSKQAAIAKPDRTFGPNSKSLGDFPGLGPVTWLRLKDLSCFQTVTEAGQLSQGPVRLFENGVDAGDINQGQLGNCWLLSSIACLATRAGAVEQVFLSREYSEEGQYQLRLWDRQAQRFENIEIDDYIPAYTSSKSPCFAKPTGNEAWALLLEKALAKFVGSYQGLKGGSPIWALSVLTGHYTCWLSLEAQGNDGAAPNRSNGTWRKMEPVPVSPKATHAEARSPRGGACMYTSQSFSHDAMFKMLEYHLSIGNLVTASTRGEQDTCDLEGVVLNHAYTLVAAKEVRSAQLGSLQMVQARNPHGAGGKEWTGNWSDASDMWSKHPEVAAALGYGQQKDGSHYDGFFWIDFSDFVKYYHNMTFCCANGFDYSEEQAAKAKDKTPPVKDKAAKGQDKEKAARGKEPGGDQAFKDPSFPHDHTSVGELTVNVGGKPVTGSGLDKLVQWCRLKDIAAAAGAFEHGALGSLKLFAAGTHPDDIDGGKSGLMVAAACLANRPFAIEELFVSGKLYKPDGEYQVKLYDPSTGEASIEPFDDWIPCVHGSPLTETKILGREVWVLLLEKAVAKLLGSYTATMHAHVCWSLACLTGEYTCQLLWQEDSAKWLRTTDMEYTPKSSCNYTHTFNRDKDALVRSEQIFQILANQLVMGCLAAAETAPSLGSGAMGLAEGRTYSVLDARLITVDDGRDGRWARLIKLRDPSRKHEWRGTWSDHSPFWKSYPKVGQELKYRPEEARGSAAEPVKGDGSFWMPYEQFLRFFRTITLCGNRLRNNLKPWVVSEEEKQKARALADAAQQLMRLRAQQEALEDAKCPEMQKQALARAEEERRAGAHGQ